MALVEEDCFGFGTLSPAAHVHEEPKKLEVRVDGFSAGYQVRS